MAQQQRQIMSLSPHFTWRAIQLRMPLVSPMTGKMARMTDLAINLVLPGMVLLHLICAPYTKVEESFNIQATHDIVAFGFGPFPNSTAHIENHYDHIAFPGSVPRTFAGALLLAGFAQPFAPYLPSPAYAQLLVRGILGLITAASLLFVRASVDKAYGKIAGRWFVLLQSSQFHVMYYASRTLPNTYALALSNVALASLISANTPPLKAARNDSRRATALYCLTIAGVIFRSELAILLAAQTIQLITQQRASLVKTIIPAGLVGAIVGLIVSVPADSFFWTRWTWPELEGFYYNTILGKSSDWGTSPFHYYFLNAIPRLLLNPVTYLVCLPTALAFKATRQTSLDTILPYLAFIFVYSFLPHKEWRFVLYSIPALTAVASGGAAWIWNRKTKSAVFAGLSLLLALSTLVSFLVSAGLLYISSLNYPGGEALQTLHALETSPRQHIYLDNLACQTGVTRFLQLQPTWIYDKTEDPKQLAKAAFWQQFDYVIAEDPRLVIGNWQVKASVHAFDGITLRPAQHEDVLPVTATNGVLRHVQVSYNAVADVLRSRLTRGYWPAVKLSTKLYLLEKEILPPNQEIKLPIQM